MVEYFEPSMPGNSVEGIYLEITKDDRSHPILVVSRYENPHFLSFPRHAESTSHVQTRASMPTTLVTASST